MSELFDDEDDKELVVEDEVVDAEAEEVILARRPRPAPDARRRLENLLDERRLRDELEDFFDY